VRNPVFVGFYRREFPKQFSVLTIGLDGSEAIQERIEIVTIDNTLAKLLNERAVANIIGVSPASLRRWPLLGHGPRFLKLGAAVRLTPRPIHSDRLVQMRSFAVPDRVGTSGGFWFRGSMEEFL
jgi:hypothetical protein